MFFTTSDGVRLFYEVDGAGLPVLMLNGLWGDTSTWAGQIKDFSEKFSCIRLDQRGIGRSEKWVGKYSYAQHARDVVELLNHLALDSVVVLATCHGGMVATTLACRYPARVRAVCINGTQLLRSERQSMIYRAWRRILETSGFETLYQSIIPAIMPEAWLRENMHRYEAMLAATLARIDHDAALCLIDACAEYGFSVPEIAELQVPALIMAGDEDAFIPHAVIQAESALWPGASYALLKGRGHFPQRECSAEYNQLVFQYLEGVGVLSA